MAKIWKSRNQKSNCLFTGRVLGCVTLINPRRLPGYGIAQPKTSQFNGLCTVQLHHKLHHVPVSLSTPYPPIACPTLPSGPSSLESVDDSLVVAALAASTIAPPYVDQSCKAEEMGVSRYDKNASIGFRTIARPVRLFTSFCRHQNKSHLIVSVLPLYPYTVGRYRIL